MKPEVRAKITEIFKLYPQVKLVYFFGSRAKNQAGPLSDYDFAVYFDPTLNSRKMGELRDELHGKLSLGLKTDKVDVVVLNSAQGPEFKYNVIKEGLLFYEQEPYRVLVEPKIMTEYFDFKYLLQKYGLTKAK